MFKGRGKLSTNRPGAYQRKIVKNFAKINLSRFVLSALLVALSLVDLCYVIEAFVSNRSEDVSHSHPVFIVSNVVNILTFSLALYLQVAIQCSLVNCVRDKIAS